MRRYIGFFLLGCLLLAHGASAANRLASELSPYLRQHAENPVEWYPWSDEAFERARSEDKPIFLSVGYSSCHWCHVMEGESFSNQEVAKVLKQNFIAIKVDREERPDIDQIYMSATQLLTGSGGWPNSVWLTPEGHPFFAATYLPRKDFIVTLEQVSLAWKEKRQQVLASAAKMKLAIEQLAQARASGTADLDSNAILAGVKACWAAYDARYGGLGGAPKFPPHSQLRFLMRHYEQTRDPLVLAMVTHSLDAMARGGIHDHVGGGFHRYSVDAEWKEPHFEKMLYDNGQLLWVYSEAYRLTKDPSYQSVAEGIIDWLQREMLAIEGAFYTSLDADSDGEEGKYYQWTRDELNAVLGKDRARQFAKAHQVGKSGPHTLARRDDSDFSEDYAKLRILRQDRTAPFRDEKILTSWNALMIAGLAHAGQVFQEPSYTELAVKAANFLLDNLRRRGELLHVFRHGRSYQEGFVDDYAFLADALIDVYQATGDQPWLQDAEGLLDVLRNQFQDPSGTGFLMTSADHKGVWMRPSEPFDRATPSGSAVAVRALARLAALTDNEGMHDKVKNLLQARLGRATQAPRFSSTLFESLALYQSASLPATESAREGNGSRVHRFPVTLELTTRREGERTLFSLAVAVDGKWHVNSDKPLQDFLVPTDLHLAEGSGYQLLSVDYPEPRSLKLGFFPEPLAVFDGNFVISGELRGGAPDEPLRLEINIQACDDETCLPPVTHTLSAS